PCVVAMASAPSGLDRGGRLRLEVRGVEGVGIGGRRRWRRWRLRRARSAVGRSVDGGEQVVMRRRLEAAADRAEEGLVFVGAIRNAEAGRPAAVAALVAGVAEGNGAAGGRPEAECRARTCEQIAV